MKEYKLLVYYKMTPENDAKRFSEPDIEGCPWVGGGCRVATTSITADSLENAILEATNVAQLFDSTDTIVKVEELTNDVREQINKFVENKNENNSND